MVNYRQFLNFPLSYSHHMLVKSMIRQFLLVPLIIIFRCKDMPAFENSVELDNFSSK